eukprot:GHVS01018069.1.p3 GENE.GHVS01018069.1~~GHVS01018069.1.p3  ORF type:complete len:138 (+),score=13.59 GHVS01018069.1:1725-2138(+)
MQRIDHQQKLNVALRIAGVRPEEPTTYGDKIQLLLCVAESASPSSIEDEELMLLTIFQSNSLKEDIKSELKCGHYIWLTGVKIFGHIEGRKTLSFGASNYGCKIRVSDNCEEVIETDGIGIRDRPPLFERSLFKFAE